MVLKFNDKGRPCKSMAKDILLRLLREGWMICTSQVYSIFWVRGHHPDRELNEVSTGETIDEALLKFRDKVTP